jgi:hypothetical protein
MPSPIFLILTGAREAQAKDALHACNRRRYFSVSPMRRDGKNACGGHGVLPGVGYPRSTSLLRPTRRCHRERGA